MTKDTFKNSDGWKLYPKKYTHLVAPLTSIPVKKKEYKIRRKEIKNINKKKRLMPNLENREIKKIKNNVKGVKNKCFFTK